MNEPAMTGGNGTRFPVHYYLIGVVLLIIVVYFLFFAGGLNPLSNLSSSQSKVNVTSIVIELNYIKTVFPPQPSHFNISLNGSQYRFLVSGGGVINFSIQLSNNRTGDINLTEASPAGGFSLLSTTPTMSSYNPIIIQPNKTTSIEIKLLAPKTSYSGPLILSLTEQGDS